MQKLPVALTSGTIPVVSYARASADLRRDEHSVEDQHRINHETARRNGWVVVAEFTDNDKSAAKMDVVRDDFELLLKVLKAGRLSDGTTVSGLVVVADDRLVRRPGDYERVVDAFTHRDGRVYADKRQIKDLYSEDVESMGLFGAVISKMEVRKMQRRMRTSHQSRAQRGVPSGGPRPFGWKDDRRTLDPAEADLVRKAARDFIGGRSVYSIVMEWQRLGVKTSLGNDWISRSLKVVLTNPRLCGWREIGGELVRGPDGNPVEGVWETIISPEEWQTIRDMFDGRKGHFVRRNGELGPAHSPDYRDARYLLVGILRCGKTGPDGVLCNTKLRVTGQTDVRQHAYACPSKSEGGCGGVSRRGDLVDEFISEALLASLEDKEMARRQGVRPQEWAGAKELNDAQERLKALSVQWNSGGMSNDLFFQLAGDLEKTIARLRGESKKHTATVERDAARQVIDVEDFRRRWYLPEEEGGMPLSTKRAYLREAFRAVIVYPGIKGSKVFNPDLLDPIWSEG
ncbi:recombinase family protein [Herbidospora yilanensis]|uniref:recombinase family protein n=1 Tax=Herbidospora yilanensis TaxID=354426 RepID=UPI0007867DF3|nr:recombinase family protein [Herbidospora yilanensis]